MTIYVLCLIEKITLSYCITQRDGSYQNLEVKLSLISIKHHAMKLYEGLGGNFTRCFTWALDRSEWSASRQLPFYRPERRLTRRLAVTHSRSRSFNISCSGKLRMISRYQFTRTAKKLLFNIFNIFFTNRKPPGTILYVLSHTHTYTHSRTHTHARVRL